MPTTLTNNPEETQALAATLATSLKGGDIILLYGDLGSGKTCFVQGLAKALGVTETVRSPSFTFVWEHRLPSLQCTMYHFDLYRLHYGDDLTPIGLSDVWGEPMTITVVEWADRLGEYMPEHFIQIDFEYLRDSKRKITIQKK